jgi:hypothetical protein
MAGRCAFQGCHGVPQAAGALRGYCPALERIRRQRLQLVGQGECL